MPKINFCGGPRDGAEIDVPFLPDQISFRNLDLDIKPPDDSGRSEFDSSIRAHWVYLLDVPSEDERSYRYAPGEKPW
jgi:hypothetical protein